MDGEDRYSEVKPLHVKTGLGSGNIIEWQQLAESVDLLHSKSKNHAHRVEKATASIRTPVKNPRHVSPFCTRQPTKRDRKISIDYKQLHEDGVFEEKRCRVEKYPPRSSGPSEIRLEAQKQILSTKKSPESTTKSHKVVTNNQYVPLRNITITDNIPLRAIKQEWVTHYTTTKSIKPEPGIYLRHRENPGDKERMWKYVHVSGRRCDQGGEQDCNSQSENEDDTNIDSNDKLPDLPSVIDPSLPLGNSNCGNMHTKADGRTAPVTTGGTSTPINCQCDSSIAHGVVDLISPPAIECRDFIPSTQQNKTPPEFGGPTMYVKLWRPAWRKYCGQQNLKGHYSKSGNIPTAKCFKCNHKYGPPHRTEYHANQTCRTRLHLFEKW